MLKMYLYYNYPLLHFLKNQIKISLANYIIKHNFKNNYQREHKMTLVGSIGIMNHFLSDNKYIYSFSFNEESLFN